MYRRSSSCRLPVLSITQSILASAKCAVDVTTGGAFRPHALIRLEPFDPGASVVWEQ